MTDTLTTWVRWAAGSRDAWDELCLYYSRTTKARYRSLDEWEKGRPL